MEKQISHYSEVEDKIIRAIDTINDPIRQTLSPRGGNVIFESANGEITVTNDGVSIAKEITVGDPYENAIIQIIKESALKTNTKAGDGTSTTILFSSVLTKGGLKLIREGMNQRDVVDWYKEFAKNLKAALSDMKLKVESDEDLFNIACISANNDKDIAKDVVKIVRAAGENGYIFMEPSNTTETEIIEDSGFNIEAGLVTPELTLAAEGMSVFVDVPVLVTDKQLYYAEEAETILNLCLQNGYKQLVVIAKGFVGEALPFFVANHRKGTVQVILVKDPHVEKTNGVTLGDLAAYLDGEVVSEKTGTIVDKLTLDNLSMAKKVYTDSHQTVIVRYPEQTKGLKVRIDGIKSELKKHGDGESEEKRFLEKRLASLTNGIVTLRLGGRTPIEVKERRYRYEDAINAGKAAVKDGYLVGGGVSILRAFKTAAKKWKGSDEVLKVFRQMAESSIRQISENSGMHGDTVLDTIAELEAKDSYVGFNALTLQYTDLLEDGVIDPYAVTDMALENSLSIASAIISSRYIIVNKKEDAKTNNKS